MKAILLMCAAAIIASATMTAAQAKEGKIGTFGGGPHSHGTRWGDLYKGLLPQYRVDTVSNGTSQLPPPKHR